MQVGAVQLEAVLGASIDTSPPKGISARVHADIRILQHGHYGFRPISRPSTNPDFVALLSHATTSFNCAQGDVPWAAAR
jgi:hypothetical protein